MNCLHFNSGIEDLNNMTDYMEYVKGGDILMAPSFGYKHQYVLKCEQCGEYYGEVEQFFSHYLSHNDMESNEEDNLSQSGTRDKIQLYGDTLIGEGGDGIQDGSDTGGEVTLSSIKEELDADETELQEFDATYLNNVNKIEYESLELEESANNSTAELVDKSQEEEKSYEEDFVPKFLTSKGNVMAFIAAYRKQPYLWNFNYPVEYGKKPERVIAWKKIATELQKTRNIPILSDQVAAVIIYIRQRYRNKMEIAENSETQNNEILPLWMFEQLSFLKPFVETEPIATLDIHQDLSPQQTVQILGILKRCPHLWDTNTIEYYCTNKRSEAITQMKNIINEEMDLDVDECTLKRYLQALQDYSAIQKRHHRGYAKGTKRKSKYFQHIIFLFAHVAPFQCSHCPQTLYSPLQFKVHTSQHDGTIPLKCYVCNKGFKLVETYTYHIRRHMDDLNHECKECGKKFMRVCELTSHIRSHTGDKPFFCEVCGISFRHCTSFNLHKKRHGKKYIAFCAYCSKGFYSKCTLDIHIRTHKDERDFVCSTCGKAFKTKRTLRSHDLTHVEGRNHECDLCGKMFKNKINLSQHRKTHGNNKTDLK